MSTPGTIWIKHQLDALTPPVWIPIGNFSQGPIGPKGPQGFPGQQGSPGAIGRQGVAGTTVSAPRGYIDGFILSNDSGTPLTVLDIGAGNATDSTSAFFMSLSAITKNCAAAWNAGSGNGGNFAASSLTNTTWYHVFIIHKTSDGSIDAGIDTSVTAANIPAGYDAYRRIGSILTDGSAHIIAFNQYGDEFWWATSVLDVNVTNPGTSAVTRTLTVPTGVKVCCICQGLSDDSSGARSYFSSLDSVDLAPAFATMVEDNFGGSVSDGAANFRVWTNTSSQIRGRSDVSTAGTAFKIRTRGWIDQRGKNS